MDSCPECGAEIEGSPQACPACETVLTGDAREASDGTPETGEGRAETGTAEPGEGVSRRGMLMYGGGSALVTWAGVGAGWFAFIREPTSAEEDVVREYVDAIDRSHFYTASNLFHENAPGEAWSAEELPMMQRVELTVERTEVVDRETEIERDDVEELALVHADVEIDDGNRSELLELAFVVARNAEGEWRLWKDR